MILNFHKVLPACIVRLSRREQSLSFWNSVTQFSSTVVCHESIITFLAVISLHVESRIVPLLGWCWNIGSTSRTTNQNHSSITIVMSFLDKIFSDSHTYNRDFLTYDCARSEMFEAGVGLGFSAESKIFNRLATYSPSGGVA